MVAPRVYEALRQPIVGHLDPYFFEVVEDIRRLLGYAFSTANEFNIAISGTGTSGMETAVANFVEPGEKFAVLANGYFCDRLSDVARRHGAVVVRLEKPWGEVFDDQEARDFIRRETPAHGGLRASGDLHRRIPARPRDLRSGARSGRAGDRRLRHLARRHARAGGRNRHRHRLQLYAEGAGLSAGTSAAHRFAARLGASAPTDRAGGFVLHGSAPARKLLPRPQISPHGVGDHVLCAARGAGDRPRRGHREPLGAPSPQS